MYMLSHGWWNKSVILIINIIDFRELFSFLAGIFFWIKHSLSFIERDRVTLNCTMQFHGAFVTYKRNSYFRCAISHKHRLLISVKLYGKCQMATFSYISVFKRICGIYSWMFFTYRLYFLFYKMVFLPCLNCFFNKKCID